MVYQRLELNEHEGLTTYLRMCELLSNCLPSANRSTSPSLRWSWTPRSRGGSPSTSPSRSTTRRPRCGTAAPGARPERTSGPTRRSSWSSSRMLSRASSPTAQRAAVLKKSAKFFFRHVCAPFGCAINFMFAPVFISFGNDWRFVKA